MLGCLEAKRKFTFSFADEGGLTHLQPPLELLLTSCFSFAAVGSILVPVPEDASLFSISDVLQQVQIYAVCFLPQKCLPPFIL